MRQLLDKSYGVTQEDRRTGLGVDDTNGGIEGRKQPVIVPLGALPGGEALLGKIYSASEGILQKFALPSRSLGTRGKK